MYCTKCGSFIPEDTINCPNCNEPVILNNNNYTSPQSGSGVYYTPQSSNTDSANSRQNYYQQNNQSYYQPNPQNNIEQEIKNNLSSANTLGILAIILGILVTPIAGLICGIIGLSKANNVPDYTMNPLIDNEKIKVKRLNKIGIIIPIALWGISIIIMVIAFMVFGFTLSSLY